MRPYVEAKLNEFSEKLSAASESLVLFSSRGHAELIAELQRVCDEIESRIQHTRKLLALDIPELFPVHRTALSQIRLRCELLEEWYFPALQHEAQEERELSAFLVRLLSELRITWLLDALVSSSRALSIYPGITNIPIFFLPRSTHRNLLDWVGLYHEIGHVVFWEIAEIRSHLLNAVLAYCELQLRYAPALRTTQLDKRAERIRQTLSYWNENRLAELFSDVFATVVVGPAYLFSWIDTSVTSRDEPYDVDLNDYHPPNAARAHACMLAVHEAFGNAPLRILGNEMWERFLDQHPTKPALFNQTCPLPLIEVVVRIAQNDIAERGFPVYSEPPLSPPESLKFTRTEDLRQLINVAMVNSVFASRDFADWHNAVTRHLHLTAQNSER